MIKKFLKRVLGLAVCAALICAVTGAAFTDVADDAWYAGDVEKMQSMGIIEGYDDGSFRPNGTVTYAELVTIIKRCAAGEAQAAASGHWAKDTMQYAYDNHWYDYDEINESMYDSPIPRYMAAKLIALGMGLPENEHEGNVYWEYMNSIKDFNSINGRYAYLVIRCYNNGVLNGDENGNFNAESSLTRAEAGAMILRAAAVGTADASATAAPAAAATAEPAAAIGGGASENGQLSVIGTQLCNKDGEPIVLRGMSTHGLHWFPQFTIRDYINMTAGYGANVFRIAMYTAEGGYISQPENVKSLLITAADNAIAEDMYVIIDWHILSDGNPMTYVEQAKSFFAEISERYKDTPNVLYEICNEPNGSVTWAGDIKPYAETIIPIIRANAPESVILVGSGSWSQNVNEAADDPLAYENIMYTCHFYAGTHGQWLRDRIDYAIGKGAPIFVSEWGTSSADGSGGVFTDASAEWLDFLDARGISWCNWSLCDKSESSAALANGALSESGEFVFSRF